MNSALSAVICLFSDALTTRRGNAGFMEMVGVKMGSSGRLNSELHPWVATPPLLIRSMLAIGPPVLSLGWGCLGGILVL